MDFTGFNVGKRRINYNRSQVINYTYEKASLTHYYVTGSLRVSFFAVAVNDTLNLACMHLMFIDRHMTCKFVHFQVSVIKTPIRYQHIQCLWKGKKEESKENMLTGYN